MASENTFDIIVVGAGAIGAAIARLLSFRRFSIAVLEAEADVAMGTSKANSAIVHAGFDCKPGTLMAALNVRGNALFNSWCRELEVPLKHTGSLVVAFSPEDDGILEKLLAQGRKNGVPGLEIITGDQARQKEPLLSPEVTRALWAPTAAITCPYEFTIACMENAAANGARLFTDAKVTALADEGDAYALACADGRVFKARAVVNAAGLFADEIDSLLAPADYKIVPRKGEYLLLDRGAAAFSTVIFQTPSKMGKGVLVSPTVDGNAFAGPTAVDHGDKQDTSVTAEGIATLKALARKSSPSIDFSKTITAFAGNRAVTIPLAPTAPAKDFILRAVKQGAKVFASASGICSPGLSSAPAIAERIVALLTENGIAATGKGNAIRTRRAIPAFRHMTPAERAAAIARDPRYGQVICRCETITEAEIVEAVRRGATTVDGVKRRTRAGMGRCQGGFCLPFVMKIIAREHGIPMDAVTKSGNGSPLAAGQTR